MNDRIRELITECETEYSTSYEPNYDMEKFAELIVKECVHTVKNRGGMCGALASNWIEEHFGVTKDD